MGRDARPSGRRPPLAAQPSGAMDGGHVGASRRRSHHHHRGGSGDRRRRGRHGVAAAVHLVKGVLHSPTGRAALLFSFSVTVVLVQTLSLYRPAAFAGLTRHLLAAARWPRAFRRGGGAAPHRGSWFQEEDPSRVGGGGAGGEGAGAAAAAARRRPTDGFGIVPIPDGVQPLPNLTDVGVAGGAASASAAAAGAAGGASASHTRFAAWAVSPAAGGGGAVAPFLRAAASAPAAGMEAAPTSVFTVRQPKGWWGCDRPFWVACKGVYRSIKRLDAVAVMDVNCLANADYLPVVFAHLRREFRAVRFVCAERDADRLAAARAKYRSVEAKTSFVTFDPFAADAAYPPRLDVVLAIGAFAGESLIRSMRLFRALHASGAARYVVFDNFPSLDNGPSVGARGGGVAGVGGVNKGRINVYKGPFMFPPAKYMYENATEVYGTEHNQIMALAVADLFPAAT